MSAKTKENGTGLKERSRVKQFERIRLDARDKDMSIRELAWVHGVHRRTVRAALAEATPPARKTPERKAPKLGPWEDTIRAWLTADQKAPRKQRHTARRIWQRLVDEHGAVVAESRSLTAWPASAASSSALRLTSRSRRPMPRAGKPRSTSASSRP